MGRNKTPDYYTPASVDSLINSIYHAEDTIKYLLSTPQYEKDSKYLTPELFESFSDLASACSELVSAYSYYDNLGLWKSANPEEYKERMVNYIASLVIAKGTDPKEAIEKARELFE